MASRRENSEFSTILSVSLLNPAVFSKFWNAALLPSFLSPARLPENKHLRLLTFPPKTGTFRAAEVPTVVPCGGASLVESVFRTRIPVRMGGFWGRTAGVSTPFRRMSQEFYRENPVWLKCSARSESALATDSRCFPSQVCLGLARPSVQLGAGSLENYV